MRKLRIAAAGLLAAAGIVTGIGLNTTPALAASGDCPAGDWCLWYAVNYNSAFPRWQWSGTDLDYRDHVPAANNNSESAYNHGFAVAGKSDVLAYDGYDGSGVSVCFHRGVARGDLMHLQSGDWFNRISGHRWTVC